MQTKSIDVTTHHMLYTYEIKINDYTETKAACVHRQQCTHLHRLYRISVHTNTNTRITHVVHTVSISIHSIIQTQAYALYTVWNGIQFFLNTQYKHTSFIVHRSVHTFVRSFWICSSKSFIQTHFVFADKCIEFSWMCNLWRSVWLMSIFQMYMYHRFAFFTLLTY